MRKRFISALLIVLCLCTMVAASEHWADEYMEKWAKHGTISQDESGDFHPDRYILKEEAAQALASIILFEADAETETVSVPVFFDLEKDSPYFEDITKVAAMGLISGIGAGEFGVGGGLTREQAAAILFRVFRDRLDLNAKASFNDLWQASEWAAAAITVLAGNGIASGYSDGSFLPRDLITRAEFIMILDKLMPVPGRIPFSTEGLDDLPVFYKAEIPPHEEPDDSLDGKKLIALTFDDGPHPTLTPQLLDIVRDADVKVTFFVLGTLAETYPDIVRRAAEEGHQIASHTYSHWDLARMSREGAENQITRSADVIEQVTGERPTAMRPPFGAINQTVRAAADTPIILWSIDPQDWRFRNADTVYERVTMNMRDGDIILLHDIHASTIEAVPRILHRLKQEGFVLVTLDELIEARGSAAVGNIYNSFGPDQPL